MNDKQKALMMLKTAVDHAAAIEPHIRDIVAKNQNRPPLGEADGSFTDEQWEYLRDMSTALTQLRVGYGLLKR